MDGDDYREWTAAKKLKKRHNLKYSTDKLIELGYTFSTHNNGLHLKIKLGGETIDYWPSTGVWIAKNTRSRGLDNLLDYLANIESLFLTEIGE